jgi:hypothetical protein
MSATRSTIATVVAIAATGAWGLVLAGCSASADDLVAAAEEFIRSDAVFEAYGVDFTDPVCEPPTATGVGGTISCRPRGETNWCSTR